MNAMNTPRLQGVISFFLTIMIALIARRQRNFRVEFIATAVCFGVFSLQFAVLALGAYGIIDQRRASHIWEVLFYTLCISFPIVFAALVVRRLALSLRVKRNSERFE